MKVYIVKYESHWIKINKISGVFKTKSLARSWARSYMKKCDYSRSGYPNSVWKEIIKDLWKQGNSFIKIEEWEIAEDTIPFEWQVD